MEAWLMWVLVAAAVVIGAVWLVMSAKREADGAPGEGASDGATVAATTAATTAATSVDCSSSSSSSSC